ncbi:uncharacterized protein LODBEIA_P59060 [Lodderomyces beijingensis]|uniref:Cytochrome c oxidase assembly protein COX20, mitochondrial n=1 Tax=Lodderomyces beijingensis TaxID=1775926 RepID=A0ABP0ZU80_9ASCO
MGWFGGSNTQAPPSKVSVVSEYQEPKPQQYLEDLPPKFEDVEPPRRPPPSPSSSSSSSSSSPSSQEKPTLADAARTISWSDFTVERYINMPCFREAMITGFQAMGVLGVVTFLVHKNVKKSLNWSVGGFFLGNLVGWEQCRSLRRRSFEMVEKAKRDKEERNRKKLEAMVKGQSDQSDLEKFEDFNNRSK